MAQAAPVPGRGELLYDTHCRGCHTEQVHWRDKKLATEMLEQALTHVFAGHLGKTFRVLIEQGVDE